MRKNQPMLKTQQENEENTITAFKYTPEYLEQAKTYNANIRTLDKTYADLTPIRQLVVRCFLIEPEVTESGLITPYKQILQVPAASGQPGKWYEFETDWPYKNKAVVVAVPDDTSIVKVGDLVQLSPQAIQVRVLGSGHNAMPVISNQFVHVNSKNEVTPKDISDPDYGYILITTADIQVKLPDESN